MFVNAAVACPVCDSVFKKYHANDATMYQFKGNLQCLNPAFHDGLQQWFGYFRRDVAGVFSRTWPRKVCSVGGKQHSNSNQRHLFLAPTKQICHSSRMSVL